MLKNKFSIVESVKNSNFSSKPSIVDYSIAQLEGEKRAFEEAGSKIPSAYEMIELNAMAQVLGFKPSPKWTGMDWGKAIGEGIENSKMSMDVIIKKVTTLLKTQVKK